MKDIGSAITYARRYSLTMLLGISSEEDKDVQFEEASKRNVESFAMLKARENIDKASGKELEKQIIFLEKELKTLAEKKTPSLGFKKENYDELLAYARTRKEDEDAKHSVDDTPAVEGEPVDVSDE
jgi:hypothetical protein